MTIDEMATVLQAAKAGKVIEYQQGGEWWPTKHPAFDFAHTVYRVKPEPREWIIDTVSPVDGRCESARAAFPVGEPPLNLIARPPEWIKVREVLE